MNDDRRSLTTKPEDTGALVNWLRDALRQVRLGWRLFWDDRVSFWSKLVPLFTLAYLISPVDIFPELLLPMLPGVTFVDDLAFLLIGLKVFVELAPPAIVREHLRELGARIEEWRVVDEEPEPAAVVEGEFEPREPERLDASQEAPEAPSSDSQAALGSSSSAEG